MHRSFVIGPRSSSKSSKDSLEKKVYEERPIALTREFLIIHA